MNVGWHNGGSPGGGGTSWLLVFATDFMFTKQRLTHIGSGNVQSTVVMSPPNNGTTMSTCGIDF